MAASTPATVLARPSPSPSNLANPIIRVDENAITTLKDPTTTIREFSPNKTFPDPPLVTHVVIDGEVIEIHALNQDLVDKILPFLKDYLCQSDDAVLFPEMCQDALKVAVPSDGYSNSTEHKQHAGNASYAKTATSTGLHNGDSPSSPPTVHSNNAKPPSKVTESPRASTTNASTSVTRTPPSLGTYTFTLPYRPSDAETILPSPSNQHRSRGGEDATRTMSPRSWSGPSWTSTSDENVTPTEKATIHPLYIPESKATDTTTTHHGGHDSKNATSHDYKAYSNSPPGGCLDLPSTFNTCTVTVTVRPHATIPTASNKPSTIAKSSSGSQTLVSDNGTSSQYPDMDDSQEMINGWARLKSAIVRDLKYHELAVVSKLQMYMERVSETVEVMDDLVERLKTVMGWDGDRETRSS